MKEQNFKNHSRYVPLFHFVMLGIVLTIIVLSVINIFSGITLSSIMFVLIAVSSLIGFLKIRRFPLAVQDRAIRAEENLRYFSLTGKLFDPRLTIEQVIALRFAPDNELVALADNAVKDNLSNKEIK